MSNPPEAAVEPKLAVLGLSEVAALLETWEGAWNRVYATGHDSSSIEQLAKLVVESGGKIELSSGTVSGRAELARAAAELRHAKTTERHRFIGARLRGGEHVQAHARIVRSGPRAFETHGRIDLQLVRIGDELLIKAYDVIETTEELAIRAMMEKYLLAWQSLDVDATQQYYHMPSALQSPKGLISFQSNDQIGQFLTGLFGQLKGKAYAKSKWLELNVLPVSPGLAVVSTVLARYDQNDNVIERTGATYQVAQHDGQWKISVGSSHPERFVLR